MRTMLDDSLQQRARRVIPAGCHTYSKGDDQFPCNAPAFIESGRGCYVTDPAGRRFLDWGMGLRSVILGHVYPAIIDAIKIELDKGSNFTRPAPIEIYLAEELVDLLPAAEMVKLAKNGSDVTTAAVRLARAATGRDIVVFPKEHPFHSFDDWFIGRTTVDAGVPDATKQLSMTFTYGDVADLQRLFDEHSGEIAAVVMEPATTEAPPEGYLETVRELTRREGTVLVFDELITGFRWHEAGAMSYYGVTPDLATFGKGMANGFAVAALVGRRDIMELGDRRPGQKEVFLLSSTNGGETHEIAAARATIAEIRNAGVVEHLWRIGSELAFGLGQAALDNGVEAVVECRGYPCSPFLAFDCGDPARSAELRTLFMQEMVKDDILIPYIAPSFSHTSTEVDRTVEAAARALVAVRHALDGVRIDRLLDGPPIRSVFGAPRLGEPLA